MVLGNKATVPYHISRITSKDALVVLGIYVVTQLSTFFKILSTFSFFFDRFSSNTPIYPSSWRAPYPLLLRLTKPIFTISCQVVDWYKALLHLYMRR
jgi:hypothetical protein